LNFTQGYQLGIVAIASIVVVLRAIIRGREEIQNRLLQKHSSLDMNNNWMIWNHCPKIVCQGQVRHVAIYSCCFFFTLVGLTIWPPFQKYDLGKIIFGRPMHAYIWPTLDPIPSSLVQLHVGEDVIVTNMLV
jgi:hypothetical protein